MKSQNITHMKIAYISALAIIAILTLASHFVLSSVIEQEYEASQLLQSSELQSKLSQQITSYATQYALGDVSMKNKINVAVDAFEVKHALLLGKATNEPAISNDKKAIRAIYLDGRYSLDNMVKEFVIRARYITTLEPDSTWLKGKVVSLATFSNSSILNALNQINMLHKQIATTQINKLSHFETASIFLILATVLATGIGIFRPIVNRVSAHVKQLELMATTDQLTGLYNFRKFHESAGIELARARRQNLKTCAIMLDLDHFKSINDTYGHLGGDKVLKAVAETMRHCLRPADIIGRVGGEEFAIILVETDMENAKRVAERLRESICAIEVETCNTTISTISASIGLARFPANNPQIEETLKIADKALYEAKNNGRNRVVVGSGRKVISKVPPLTTPEVEPTPISINA